MKSKKYKYILEENQIPVNWYNIQADMPNPLIREANQAKVEGKETVILFNLCGHGYLDMSAYQDYFDGKLKNHELTDAEVKRELSQLTTPVIN